MRCTKYDLRVVIIIAGMYVFFTRIMIIIIILVLFIYNFINALFLFLLLFEKVPVSEEIFLEPDKNRHR